MTRMVLTQEMVIGLVHPADRNYMVIMYMKAIFTQASCGIVISVAPC
jgi:hypothetical protein